MVNQKFSPFGNSILTPKIEDLSERGAELWRKNVPELTPDMPHDMPYAPHETVADAIKRAGLPENHDVHWSQARKDDVVRAVRDKLISFDEARWRYLLSRREFQSWEERFERREQRHQAKTQKTFESA